MSPTNEQIIAEADRRWKLAGAKSDDYPLFVIEVMREGWTPPEPVVDPDLLAWREWMANRVPTVAHWYLSGSYDAEPSATAFLAGARMATERERERAKVLVEYVRGYACPESEGADILAKYEEGGR